MSNIYRIIIIFLLATLVVSCTTPSQPTPLPTNPSTPSVTAQPTSIVSSKSQIARHPAADDFSGYFSQLTSIPKFDPNSEDSFQVDLRSQDLSQIDMTNSLNNLMYADFDSQTKWPAADKMPVGFDWQKIMEVGKDPGLGIRDLHQQGITGKGVSIAIIDQPLLVDHEEYKDRVRFYEEINVLADSKATMHGAAVSSIAVGRTIGVAPQADLYYIGSWTGDWEAGTNNFTWNFTYYAQAVRRMLEINRGLPDDRKIHVIAMQVGWSPDQKGYDDITAAVNEAKAAGIFVISSSLSETYGLHFHGLGRNPLNDPNECQSYEPGLWWQNSFYQRGSLNNTLLVPMDSRTTASPTATEDYVFYREGGWSWSIPYLAGMYALAAQVKPDVTPEVFWEAALETGKTIQIQHDGKEYQFGVILDPQTLIHALQSQ